MALDDLKKNLNNNNHKDHKDHKCDCGKKDCEKCNKHNKKHPQHTKRKFNKFADWIAPIGMTAEEIESYQLIYGVAMSEGTMKGDEIMTAENVISATGALAASAFFGFADIDIDHYYYSSDLPEEYIKKYGKELIEVWPPAMTLDAQAMQNEVETENGKEKLYQSEFFGICENKHVYEMIKNANFKGCSVVDYYRRDNCDKCDSSDGTCGCITEGSKFLYHTLILDEVPNSNATWVAAITKDNIGDLFDFSDEATVESFKKKINSIKQRKAKHAHNFKKHELAEYKSDDGWISEESAQEFLENEKGIESELAAEIAAFITEHPDLLNDYQLEYLSMEDIIAWYQAAQGNKNIHAIRHNLAVKQYLIKNAKDMKELHEMNETMNKFVPFGQGEVDYMGSAENQCQKCRFFVESDDGVGDCVIVAGEVAASGGCNKWDEAPGMADPDNPDDGGDGDGDGDGDPAPTDPEAPTDPDDPAGGDDPETVEPNADGTCPDGYEINADGTMCTKITTAPASSSPASTKKSLKDLRKTAQSKIKPKVTIESNPDDAIKVNAVLDSQINGIEKQIIEHEVIFPGDSAHIQQAKLEDLRKELRRLQSLKKKSPTG
ncbi:MAG: hypothetical protein OXC46_03145 [Thaumarchaeota archaeon]|nr:hypothetical protein [Nitrososphaerota archaeon]